MMNPLRVAGVLAAILSVPGAVAAQDGAELHAVRAQVLLDGLGAAHVHVAYRITGTADTLRLRAIPFFGLTTEDVGVAGAGRLTGMEREPAGALQVSATVPADGWVELTYTVPDADVARGNGRDVRVPVFLPAGVRSIGADDFFSVELRAGGLTVVESFPTVAAAASPDASVTHAMALPAAPSLLRWRLVAGAAPRATVAGLVDAGLFGLLLVLGVVGVRALRRLPAEG